MQSADLVASKLAIDLCIQVTRDFTKEISYEVFNLKDHFFTALMSMMAKVDNEDNLDEWAKSDDNSEWATLADDGLNKMCDLLKEQTIL